MNKSLVFSAFALLMEFDLEAQKNAISPTGRIALFNASTIDTLSLSNRINKKLNITDTAGLSKRFYNINTDQTINGNTTFINDININLLKIGRGRLKQLFNLIIGDADTHNKTTSGTENTGIGFFQFTNNTQGSQNVAIGNYALQNNTVGSYNLVLGWQSLLNNTSGSKNIALGSGVLNANRSGSSNVALGYNALFLSRDASLNICLGDLSLSNLLSGTGNIVIGASQEVSNALSYSSNYTMNIGGVLFGTGLTGSWGSPAGNIGIKKNNPAYTLDVNGDINGGNLRVNGTNITSDVRLKTNIRPIRKGLQTLAKLRPVVYQKRMSLQETQYPIQEFGFIANELQRVLPFLVLEGKDPDKILSINYLSLIPLITKSITEMDDKVKKLEKIIEEQNKVIREYELSFEKDKIRLKDIEKRLLILEKKAKI